MPLGQEHLRGVSLFLIGMMGSGKTTVGQHLAQHIGYGFVDADQVIEQAAGQSIPQIFATQGEAAFRDLETQVLTELASFRNLVVATGGGIVVRRENWGCLRHGVVVWLNVPVPELVQRLAQGSDQRPLLQTDDPTATLTALMEHRLPLYAQADVCVDLAGIPLETAVEHVWQQTLSRLRPSSVG